MKIKIWMLLVLVGFSQVGFSQNFGSSANSPTANTATAKWLNMEEDLGEIPQHKPVTVKFKVKNEGLVPLLIMDVQSTCGCTVPDKPKKPIQYGETAEITATFDAKSAGAFYKTIKVTTNDQKKVVELRLKGTVVK